MLIQHERGSSLTITGTPRKQRDRMRGFLPAFFWISREAMRRRARV